MALKDSMHPFQLLRPALLQDAVSMAEQLGEDGWVMAGGQDSLDWFKDRARRPPAVIDLTLIDELRGIREVSGGVEIGALTTLTEVANNSLLQNKFALLSTAAERVASPQIRNIGTLGGNLCQDTRCWYFRSGLHCYRAGGTACYADTPEGMNREHCLFGASRCVAVTPSDTAPTLVTLNAKMVIRNSGGERVVPAEEFFVGPAINITHMTVLRPGDILTSIRIPSDWAGATFYFEKVADRNTWDFALVSIASAMKISGNKIEQARFTCGAVECVPRRLQAAERAVQGKMQSEKTAVQIAELVAKGAVPLNYNHFKVALMENLVKRAIRDS